MSIANWNLYIPGFNVSIPALPDWECSTLKKGNIPYFAKPCSSFGYTRNYSLIYGGDGSTYGPIESGVGDFSQGTGPVPSNGLDITLGAILPLLAVAVLIFCVILKGVF